MTVTVKHIRDVYKANQEFLRAAMVEKAEAAVQRGVYSQFAYETIYDDGFLEPFLNAPVGGAELLEAMDQSGDHDIVNYEYATDVWIEALKSANNPDFEPIIAKLDEICKEGL